MSAPNEPATANAAYLALKVLAFVAELGMVAGVFYAGWTTVRYWSGIGV